MDTYHEPFPEDRWPSEEFCLGTRRVVVKEAETLNVSKSVCRLHLEISWVLAVLLPIISQICPSINVYWPEWFLPPTVIIKKQKEDRIEEYLHEIKAYSILKPLQGTIIPCFYGQTIYDSSPAMILSDVEGINLDPFSGAYNWDRRWNLGTQLENALKGLWSYGVILERPILSNFLWVDKERVVIVDLSLVSFHAAGSSHWRPYLNVLVSRLLDDFRNDYTESRRQIGAREIFIGKDPKNVVDALPLISILRKPVKEGFSSRGLLNRPLFWLFGHPLHERTEGVVVWSPFHTTNETRITMKKLDSENVLDGVHKQR